MERRHFQCPWTTPIPGFKVTLFFDAEYLRNGTRYRHSFIGILIGTYIRPTVSFRMTLSDLEWLSKIFHETKHRAAPLRQQSYLLRHSAKWLTAADKAMNPKHFLSDPADIRIRIWINPEIWILSLTFFRSLGTCSLWRYGSCISATDSHAFCKQKKA